MHYHCPNCQKVHGRVMLIQSGGVCHACQTPIPYQCENCGTELKSIGEMGHTHRLSDCFASLRQRIEALEKKG